MQQEQVKSQNSLPVPLEQ